jgi:hypothetical protein
VCFREDVSNAVARLYGVVIAGDRAALLNRRLNPETSTKERMPGTRKNSPLFEIALVLVRFDHVASFIVNVNHQPLPKKEPAPFAWGQFQFSHGYSASSYPLNVDISIH